MKANELRIGNYVNDVASQPFKVAANCIVALVQCEAAKKIHIGYNPIPLTEEILLKCGFDRIGNNFEYDWLLIHTHLSTGEFHFLLNESKSGKLKVTNLKYVHQLQNIYFALTGEELTITL